MCVCVQWWFKKFSKGDESLEDQCSGWPEEGDNEKLRPVIEVDSFKTTWEVAKELEDNHFMVFWHLKWIGKVKRLNKWVPHELTAKKKKKIFWGVIFSYSVQNKKTFLDQIGKCFDKWILYNRWWPVQWFNQEAPKHFPNPNLHQNKGHGHCLVVSCPSGPLQLSEFWWNHYIREVCSANRWDALKIAMPADSNG